jgi:NAD(P)-dependent dehydrogenase (short-subunit alcohol dehydrogenase family)
MPRFDSGATALVIGASGGIGLAMTRHLLADPRFARVIASCRDPRRDGELHGLGREHHRLEQVALDATDPEAFLRLGADLRDRDIRPALVIYCAGLLHDGDRLQPEKRLEEIELDALQRVFAVNTFGPALMFKSLLPLFGRHDPCVMAVVSARVGSIEDNRLGGWYAYRASKAGLNQIMRTAKIEARRRFKGCILACVHPGTTDTALSRPFQANVPEDKLFPPAFVAERFMSIFEALEIEDSGAFLAWDGAPIPW